MEPTLANLPENPYGWLLPYSIEYCQELHTSIARMAEVATSRPVNVKWMDPNKDPITWRGMLDDREVAALVGYNSAKIVEYMNRAGVVQHHHVRSKPWESQWRVEDVFNYKANRWANYLYQRTLPHIQKISSGLMVRKTNKEPHQLISPTRKEAIDLHHLGQWYLRDVVKRVIQTRKDLVPHLWRYIGEDGRLNRGLDLSEMAHVTPRRPRSHHAYKDWVQYELQNITPPLEEMPKGPRKEGVHIDDMALDLVEPEASPQVLEEFTQDTSEPLTIEDFA